MELDQTPIRAVPITPCMKLVLSSVRRPFWYKGLLRPTGYSGCLTWNSTIPPRTLIHGLLGWVRMLNSCSLPGTTEGGKELGSGKNLGRWFFPQLSSRSARRPPEPADVVITLRCQQLIGDDQQASSQRNECRLLAACRPHDQTKSVGAASPWFGPCATRWAICTRMVLSSDRPWRLIAPYVVRSLLCRTVVPDRSSR